MHKALAHIAIEAAARAYHRAEKQDQPELEKELLLARSTLQTSLILRTERTQNNALRLQLLRDGKLDTEQQRTFRVWGV